MTLWLVVSEGYEGYHVRTVEADTPRDAAMQDVRRAEGADVYVCDLSRVDYFVLRQVHELEARPLIGPERSEGPTLRTPETPADRGEGGPGRGHRGDNSCKSTLFPRNGGGENPSRAAFDEDEGR